MDPLHLFTANRLAFEGELDNLIGAAVATSPTPAPPVTSPISELEVVQPDPRKRAAIQMARPSKKVKGEEGLEAGFDGDPASPPPSLGSEGTSTTAGMPGAPTMPRRHASMINAAEARRLFIGNVSRATTTTDLKEFFKGYSVESAAAPSTTASNDPRSTRSHRTAGYAFVDVTTTLEAERAINELNGRTLLDRKVTVQLALKPERGRTAAQGLERGGGQSNLSGPTGPHVGLSDTIYSEELDGNVAQYSQHVHSSRRVLRDRPNTQQMRQVFGSPVSQRTTQSLSYGRLVQPTAADSAIDQSFGTRTALSSPPSTGDNPQAEKTWVTNRNAVRRQWDTRKDDLEYEALLELRRSETVDNIDRYVPPVGNPKPSRRPEPKLLARHLPPATGSTGQRKPRKDTCFPLEQLPKPAQARILTLLLVSNQPIEIDFTWLRTFVNGHARLPTATQTIEHESGTYHVPISWNKLTSDVSLMQDDMRPFQFALEERAIKTRKTKAPCRGLTTSLLRVSKSVHDQAAQVFYGLNTFAFPWRTSAWMQLESFLVTIGPKNVSHLRNIRTYVPLWHRGIQEDFVEGAVIDLTSPVSRLAVIKPPAHDRLLSAIESSVQALCTAGKLKSLTFEIEHGRMTDLWINRCHNHDALISVSDAEEYVSRKQKGLDLLKQISEILRHRPTLSVYTVSRPTDVETRAARDRYLAVVGEAKKYGWKVDPNLKHVRRSY